MAGKIVVVGSSNTDMILQMEHIPRPGETILGGRFAMAAGGKGANQAVAAARAGGQVALVARVGRDMFGRQALDGFRRDGIAVSAAPAAAFHPSSRSAPVQHSRTPCRLSSVWGTAICC